MDWLIENEIILIRYQGVITADELLTSLIAAREMIVASPRQHVHVISDVGNVSEAVPFAEVIRIVRARGRHPRTGWTITLRERAVGVRLALALCRSMLLWRTATCETIDEALAHLRRFDPALTWDRLNPVLISQLSVETDLAVPGRSISTIDNKCCDVQSKGL